MQSPSSSSNWPAAIIPLHYHYHMLNDEVRMTAFHQAIDFVVRPGAKVLELGGGTAVLSFLASRLASKVYCVELEAPNAAAAREILRLNGVENVEVIHADALQYLPPEPVDVVICEMIHVAMVREQQMAIMDSFRSRYLEKFGAPLPVFIPCAAILAVQPVHQDFTFHGYTAPVPVFQQADIVQPRTIELGEPVVTHLLDYHTPLPSRLNWSGTLTTGRAGEWNALRFITKNVLSVDEKQQPAHFINWFSQYLVLPLPTPRPVQAGSSLEVSFDYPAGAEIADLQQSIRAPI